MPRQRRSPTVGSAQPWRVNPSKALKPSLSESCVTGCMAGVISMLTALLLPRSCVVVGGMCARASAVGVSAPCSKMRAEQPDCALGDDLHSRLAVSSRPHAPLWTICYGSEQCSTNASLRFALLRTCTHPPCTFVRQLRAHCESLTQRKQTSPKPFAARPPLGFSSAADLCVTIDCRGTAVCCRRRTPGSCSYIGGLNVSAHTERSLVLTVPTDRPLRLLST